MKLFPLRKKHRIFAELAISMLLFWPLPFWGQLLGSFAVSFALESYYRRRNDRELRDALRSIHFEQFGNNKNHPVQ